MKTTAIGWQAEQRVAEYLQKQGYKILARNWRTRVCEIDIVAQKDNAVYFVEVKYRSSDKQGGGWEYITPQKMHKMHFAAEVWLQNYRYEGDWCLLAAEISEDGEPNLVEVA